MGKLLDSVQNYFKNGSKEQFLRDWEELKHFNEAGPDILEVINRYLPPQPLFTLTAEEVEDMLPAIETECGKLGQQIIENPEILKSPYEEYGWIAVRHENLGKLLTRIKQWQDENR